MQYSFENLLREPWELAVGVIAIGFAALLIRHPLWFSLEPHYTVICAGVLVAFGLVRIAKGIAIYRYCKRLLVMKTFALSTTEVPLSPQLLYIGRGFDWQVKHRQRLNLLLLPENAHYREKGKLYRALQYYAGENPQGLAAWCTRQAYLPFKPLPPIGGKPYLHGVGSDAERNCSLPQSLRVGHQVIFGVTRVGKTRLASILVNQDIRRGEAVIFIDPKGDLSILQDMYCACKAANRLQDFFAVHAGLPDVSARYNPLASYSNVSDVASRVTSAMSNGSGNEAFTAFAWKYVNITAICLEAMGERITYKSIEFFIFRPQQLLTAHAEKVLPESDPQYLSGVQAIIDGLELANDEKDETPEDTLSLRAEAIRQYVGDKIESLVQSGQEEQLHDDIIADLYLVANMSQDYYSKITASVGPVLDKINKTQASSIFSWRDGTDCFGLPEVDLATAIAKKQVIYIGLDSLTNKAMSDAVGQAIIADLVSLCGRLYKDVPNPERILCLYSDEFSEVVKEEFITLLNKAGGAGVQVTALGQTVQDLGASFGNNPYKPKQLLGNFNSIFMMRVANRETCQVFTDAIEKVTTRSLTPSSATNDRHNGDDALFNTNNSDVVSEAQSPIIVDNDIISLPKGQAFVMSNGGHLMKIRVPLPKNTGEAPPTFETLMREVNLCYV